MVHRRNSITDFLDKETDEETNILSDESFEETTSGEDSSQEDGQDEDELNQDEEEDEIEEDDLSEDIDLNARSQGNTDNQDSDVGRKPRACKRKMDYYSNQDGGQNVLNEEEEEEEQEANDRPSRRRRANLRPEPSERQHSISSLATDDAEYRREKTAKSPPVTTSDGDFQWAEEDKRFGEYATRLRSFLLRYQLEYRKGAETFTEAFDEMGARSIKVAELAIAARKAQQFLTRLMMKNKHKSLGESWEWRISRLMLAGLSLDQFLDLLEPLGGDILREMLS